MRDINRNMRQKDRERERKRGAPSIFSRVRSLMAGTLSINERNINSLDQNQHPQISLHLPAPPLTLLNTHNKTHTHTHVHAPFVFLHQAQEAVYPPLYLHECFYILKKAHPPLLLLPHTSTTQTANLFSFSDVLLVSIHLLFSPL